MPRLRSLSGAEVRFILEAHGFTFVSKSGSHIKLRKTDENGLVWTVIVPDHKTVQIGTLTSIIRQSGLGRAPFEA